MVTSDERIVLIIMIVVVTVVVGYVVTSCLLIRFPGLLHKKKHIKFKVRHISHRGGAGEYLENTMEAFRAAHELGTDMFEIDCQLTRDHQVVISHDDHLIRTTGKDVFVSQTDYQDLPPLKDTLEVQFDPRCMSSGQDVRIPLLSDLFDMFPEVPVNIDLKEGSERLIAEVQQLIEDYNREAITVWGNRSMATNSRCREKNPEILTFVSMKGAVMIILSFYAGLLPFFPIHRDCLEVPMPSIFLKKGRYKQDPGWKMRLAIRIVDCLVMSPMLFQHLQRRGMHVHLWVLNDEAEFKRAFSHGVTAVMTDYPSKLHSFLLENPDYR